VSLVKPWWRSASVYQLYVRSFADANGDGIGDLAGITQRLGHVKSLGVDAIWLNPCFPSPQRDHGYDVSDYFAIEADYGDLAAFDQLIDQAHGFGLRVLLDVVPNHCSRDHQWFLDAIAAGPGSVERARFWFRPGRGVDGCEPPNNWKAIFGGSAWTRITEPNGEPGEWYLGVFTPDQPDWNFSDPTVADHFDRMLRFWFDRGVDGFRADAVIYLGKVYGLPDANEVDVESPLNPMFTYVQSQHDVWRRWRTLVDTYEVEHGRELLLVAEAFSPNNPALMLEYANPTEFHQTFAFDLMLAPWRAEPIRNVITSTLAALAPAGLLPAWTLNNHDTQRTATRYGRNDIVEMGGFHAGQFRISDAPIDAALGQRRARAATLLLLGLPGCVYLYAGEELGLPEVLDLPDAARQDPVFFNSKGESIGRDGCRIPLPWTCDPSLSFGFTSPLSVASTPTLTSIAPSQVLLTDSASSDSSPAEHVMGTSGSTGTPWLPQPADWGTWSVEAQTEQANSMLSLYRVAGKLRRELGGLQGDSFAWIEGLPLDLLAFRRGDVVVAFNPTDTPFSLPEDVIGNAAIALSSVYGHNDPHTVPANATIWLVPKS
jgi:alpha-glucosidase